MPRARKQPTAEDQARAWFDELERRVGPLSQILPALLEKLAGGAVTMDACHPSESSTVPTHIVRDSDFDIRMRRAAITGARQGERQKKRASY